jgi:tRNA threonylcarbamoyladenosine biosynthesis protein TsaE
MKFENISISDLDSIACQIINAFPEYRIFLLDAGMGAGKTTLIRRLCACLGVEEDVTSPTFAIINVYDGANNSEIYHFDFYRLEHIEDAFQIGFYEYLDSGNYCFLEWPAIVNDYIRDAYVKISIQQVDDPNLRNIYIESFG